MTTRPSPHQVLAVHRTLAGAGVPHAIGGAVALGIYGAPRETTDIDVNVFVAVAGWEEVKLDWQGTTVHLFFDLDELHAAMPAAVREVPYAGATIPVVAPEHLVVRKTLLDRPKDRADIESLRAANPGLDRAEIDRWVRRLVS
jgi:hypothetical protein